MKLNYNLITPYISKGFDQKKINFQYELIELQKFKADAEQIWVTAFDYSFNYLATGGRSGVLKIWKINTLLDDENKYIKSIINKNKEISTNKEEIKSF